MNRRCGPSQNGVRFGVDQGQDQATDCTGEVATALKASVACGPVLMSILRQAVTRVGLTIMMITKVHPVRGWMMRPPGVSVEAVALRLLNRVCRASAKKLISKSKMEKGARRHRHANPSSLSKVDRTGATGRAALHQHQDVLEMHAPRNTLIDTRSRCASPCLQPFASSTGLSMARAVSGVESMHWLLDVAFKDDLSRYRTGHGAKSRAGKSRAHRRRFALGLVRASVKTKRKSASWNKVHLLELPPMK
jgi:hypothetical protein